MLDRSGWTYKRMRLTTKWAVEIARQKVFGTRPICPIEVTEPKDSNLCNRILPERKAAIKAKERLKELSLHDQAKGSESGEDLASSKSKHSSRKRHGVHNFFNSLRISESTENSENNRGSKNSKQLNRKLGKNKALKLSRKDKALIRKFKIKPCIVCIPALKDVRKVINKTEEPVRGKCATNVNTKYTGVNKRKSKKPTRIIKLGESDRDPIVLSDDDSDSNYAKTNLSLSTRNENCPVTLGYDSDDVEDLISIDDINEQLDDNDPNDADTEEDSNEYMDDIYDSFDENSDVFSVNENVYKDDGNADDNDSFDDDNDDEYDEEFENCDDDYALTFVKAHSPKTYGGIRGKTLIAPATFQPTKFKVAPPKFMLPPTFRAGVFIDY